MQFVYFIIFTALLLNGCSKVRESAGVTRKSIDEFQVVEYPPLVIPPDFNLVSPDQLESEKIDIIESELAKDILFGLDDEEILVQNSISTMNQILLNAGATNSPSSIREEIDENYMKEINTNGIFQNKFFDEIEILDAVKESERIRDKKFKGELISEGDIPIINQIKERKKKKRFFFF